MRKIELRRLRRLHPGENGALFEEGGGEDVLRREAESRVVTQTT